MVRTLLIWGMVVGIVAGLLAFGFAKVFGEPQVDRAMAFEDQMDRAKGEAPGPELVSRPVQSGVGLLTGVLVYGTALGGLFALAFAFAYQRIGRLSARGTSALLAAAGFIAIFLVPQLKYPSSPPSVGQPETIGYRSELFFLMILISVAALGLAIVIAPRLAARYGNWNAALLAAALFIGIIVVSPSPFTGYQRSTGPIPGRRFMAFPDRFVWYSAGLVGNVWFVIRCPGRESASKSRHLRQAHLALEIATLLGIDQ